VEQKTDRPVAQHVVPKGDRRAFDFFPKTVEPQQFRHGWRRQIVDLECHATGMADNLVCHRPEDLQPGEPAFVLAASAPVAPPQPCQIHFGCNSCRGFRLAAAEFDDPRQVEQVSRYPPRGVAATQNNG